MVRVLIYSNLELAILNNIKRHLDKEFQKLEIEITGGIHIRPKPKSARLDSIELNTTGLKLRQDNDYVGYINVNYQDDDYDKTREYTRYIGDLMSESIIHRYYFKQSNQQIIRISPYLWMGNNLYQLKII